MKTEYASLIAEAQAIKADLEVNETKVNRSMQLLGNLEAGTKEFEVAMSTLAGDALIAAAFLGYGGYFDQTCRAGLITHWKKHLSQAGVGFRTDLARTEFLSEPAEQLRWKQNALPDDGVCTENAAGARCLIAVNAALEEQCIPIKHFLLNSWWYGARYCSLRLGLGYEGVEWRLLVGAGRPQLIHHRGVLVSDSGSHGCLARKLGIQGRWVDDASVDVGGKWQQQLDDGKAATRGSLD